MHIHVSWYYILLARADVVVMATIHTTICDDVAPLCRRIIVVVANQI
jgi:hypothetical protein